MTEDRRLPVSEKCPQCTHYGTVNVTKAELTEILSADKIDYFCLLSNLLDTETEPERP